MCGCADYLSRRDFLWEMIGQSIGVRRAPLPMHPTRPLAERNAQERHASGVVNWVGMFNAPH